MEIVEEIIQILRVIKHKPEINEPEKWLFPGDAVDAIRPEITNWVSKNFTDIIFEKKVLEHKLLLSEELIKKSNFAPFVQGSDKSIKSHVRGWFKGLGLTCEESIRHHPNNGNNKVSLLESELRALLHIVGD